MPVSEVVNGAYGVKLKHGTGSPLAYTAIAQITKIDGPGREVGERETTNLDSEADEWAPTLTKNGELSGELEYDPQGDTHKIMDDYVDNPAVADWQLLLPDTVNGQTTFTFRGFVKKFSPTGMEREANLVASFTIRVTGKITKAKVTP